LASRVHRIQKNQRIFLIFVDQPKQTNQSNETYETHDPQTCGYPTQIRQSDDMALHQAGMVYGTTHIRNYSRKHHQLYSTQMNESGHYYEPNIIKINIDYPKRIGFIV
jgi:hypothetical protein